MSWTKKDLIVQAYEEIGYASYVFDLEPEQMQSALRRLDSLMATWNGEGIAIGYLLPSSPENSSLDDLAGVPDWSYEAIYLELAKRLAPTVGKQVSQETKVAAREAYKILLKKTQQNNTMQLPTTLPLGAGNKPFRGGYSDQFVRDVESNIITPPQNGVEFDA